MTLRRAFDRLLCLLVLASSTTLVHADSWTYTSAANAAPGGNGLSIGFQPSAPGAVTTSLFASDLSSCTSCLGRRSNVFADRTALSDALNFRNASRFPYGSLNQPAAGVSGARFNPETVTSQVAQGSVSSTVTPESSSIVLLLGGIVCIFVGVRGKAKAE